MDLNLTELNIGYLNIDTGPGATFNTNVMGQTMPKLTLSLTAIALKLQEGDDSSLQYAIQIFTGVHGKLGEKPTFESGLVQGQDGEVKWDINLTLPIEQILHLGFWTGTADAGPEPVGECGLSLLDIITCNPVHGVVNFQHLNKAIVVHLDKTTLQNILRQVVPQSAVVQALVETSKLAQTLSSSMVSDLIDQVQRDIHLQVLYSKQLFDLLVQLNSFNPILVSLQKIELQHVISDSGPTISNFFQDILCKLLDYSKMMVQAQIQKHFDDAPLFNKMQIVKAQLDNKLQNSYKEILEMLQHIAGRSESTCLKGTRTDVLKSLDKWAHSGQTSMLWLSGAAGTGKSTVAATFARMLPHNKLAGYHTCRRGSEKLESATLLVQNLCYQLAHAYKPLGAKVAQTVTHHFLLSREHSIPELFEKLFYEPLKRLEHSIQPNMNLVLIVDALDECGSIDNRVQILEGFNRLHTYCTWIKVFITSRPNEEIATAMQQDTVSNYVLTPEGSAPDVRLFMEYRLHEIPEISSEVPRLVEYTSGLFIWAQTACNYIMEKFNKVLAVKQIFDGHPTHHAPVNLYHLYGIVLQDAVGSDPDNIHAYKKVMTVVLLAAEAINETAILGLISKSDLEQITLKKFMAKLRAILYIGQDGKYYVLHPSFRDYAFLVENSKHFHIPLESHGVLFERALIILEEQLTFNICDLRTSYKLNAEISNLNEKIEKNISPALKYSAMYWIHHALHSNTINEDHQASIKQLCTSVKVLFWIEVLSLLKHVRKAALDIIKLKVLLRTNGELYKELEDISLFLSRFEYCISTSTPHLYISALAMVPEQSRMACHWNTFKNRVQVLNHQNQTWTSTQDPPRTICGHTRCISSLAISPDGKYIVSGSDDKTLGIWNAQTGQQVGQLIKCHADVVTCVSFSPDNTHIVSGSRDKTCRIWYAETGQQVGQTQVHADQVTSVWFLPDGRQIASLAGAKISIWDIQSGKHVKESWKGHQSLIWNVSFSCDSSYIISASLEDTIKLWDAHTGKQIGKGFKYYNVQQVLFLPDSMHIVIATSNAISIFDIHTHKQAQTLKQDGKVTSLSVSPDGGYIAFGMDEGNIRIWNIQTEQKATQLVNNYYDWFKFGSLIHKSSQGYTSITLSPDGRYIVSGSKDKSIRVWNIHSGQQVGQSLKGHKHGIHALSFSTDSTYIVSASYDGIRFWDLESGQQEKQLWKDYISCQMATSFSPDCRCIVTPGFRDLKMWGVLTGKQMCQPRSYSCVLIKCLSISPNGRFIASGSDDAIIRIWNANSNKQVGCLRGHRDAVMCLSFSHDGRYLVSGSRDETIRMWGVGSHRQVDKPLKGHTGDILSIACFPDGKHIVSASSDQTIRLWNTQTGQQVGQSLTGHRGTSMNIVVLSDGRHFVSISDQDDKIKLWCVATLIQPLHAPPMKSHFCKYYFSPDSLLSSISFPSLDIFSPLSCGFSSNNSFLQNGWFQVYDHTVLWIPDAYREKAFTWEILSIPVETVPGKLFLNWSKFVHGDQWHKIYTPLSEDLGADQLKT
ncbi:WD40 repeat-like protein [Pluteus cervinus]|uniref:WD40 repeat-like protein n=1 Tax=Pluteus cervinus TaxID=181527 RepID=A0ACD3A4Q9_9AGAR|nr:WD40 repeat-like protein [Pluteus cervinus]